MKYVITLALLLVLSACSTTPPRPLPDDPQLVWETRQQRLQRVDTWLLSGRAVIQAEDDGWQFTLNWQQQADNFDIQMIAPLGQGSLILSGGKEQVTLRTSDGEEAWASDPDTLVYRILGWRIPVSALRYWIRGIPAPGTAEVSIDEYGRLGQLQQSGWTVTFPEYRDVNSLEMPTKVFVSNHRAGIKLVISDWNLNPDLTLFSHHVPN